MMLSTPLMLCVRHSHPALSALERQVPEVAAANRASAEVALKLFDRRLAEGEFIATDQLTIADVVAFTGLEFARMVQFRPGDEHVHFSRWANAMRERPAAGAGL